MQINHQTGRITGLHWESWSVIEAAKYTATPASTSRITMTDTSDMAVGLPLKYTYNGTTYWGRVDAISVNSYIDIRGAALNTGQDLTELAVGSPSRLVMLDLFVSGTYGDGADNALLANDMNTYLQWNGPAACLVGLWATQKTVDAGAEPEVLLRINGTDVAASNIALSTGGVWVALGAVAVSTAAYDVQTGESIEVACKVAGGTGDASDLTMAALFVLQ